MYDFSVRFPNHQLRQFTRHPTCKMVLFNAFVLPFLLALTFPHAVHNSNILAFVPSPGRSHSVPFHPLFRELAGRGHNLTLFSHFPMKTPTPNVNNIVIEADIPMFGLGFANLRKYTRLFNWKYVHDEVQTYLRKLVRDKQLTAFFHTLNTKFDLVFVELYHLDASIALGHLYDCPVIGLSVQPMLPPYHWALGSPTTFSHIPHSYLPYTDAMSFWQRSANAFMSTFTMLYYNYFSVPEHQKTVDFMLTRRGGQTAPSIDDLTRNLSLAFVEAHFSCAIVRPNPPNVIDVAGIHIEESQHLPQDIQKFMDEAEHGVIYVSLGTLVDPHLAVHLGSKLLKIFKTLPQRVIWKWKKVDSADSSGGDLMLREWLPQLEILNHPKCRLFISHGGFHSVMETIYSGVPILGLPFFTDQYHNMAVVLKKNIGRKVDPDFDATELRAAIRELLEDDSYRQRCRKQSAIFKDRPVKPLDTAVFWTEHVLRHKGAAHFKTAAQDLYWYEYLLLDVIFIPALAAGSLVFALVIILRKLTNALRSVLVKNSSVKGDRSKKCD